MRRTFDDDPAREVDDRKAEEDQAILGIARDAMKTARLIQVESGRIGVETTFIAVGLAGRSFDIRATSPVRLCQIAMAQSIEQNADDQWFIMVLLSCRQ